MIKKYVITGVPGSGKTSTLLALKKKGYTVVEEAARKIIEEEMRGNKKVTIWENIEERQKKIFELQLKLEKEAEEKAKKRKSNGRIIFIDRGIPDCIAYLKISKNKIPKKLKEEVKKNKRKYKKIFYLEMVPYKKDKIRKEPEEIARKLGEITFKVYKKLGYRIIKVPLMSIDERVKFIEKNL